MTPLEKAIALASRAHAGQVDKAGLPYILHPLRVMLRLERDDERIVAVLHDVVEDTACTLRELHRQGFGERLVRAVDALTRREGEEYDDYIGRVARDPLALRVKLQDLRDNMDPSRLPVVREVDRRRLRRYRAALRRLRQVRSAGGRSSRERARAGGRARR